MERNIIKESLEWTIAIGVITKMIGIKFIDASNMRTFAERLETFMNEHTEAKILFGQVKGIEGGKGVFAILSYDKKEESRPEPAPIPVPKKPKVDPKDAELQKLKDQYAELQALRELEKKEEAEVIVEPI